VIRTNQPSQVSPIKAYLGRLSYDFLDFNNKKGVNMASNVYQGIVYAKMSDNLTKVKFDVRVKESYSPITLFKQDPETGKKTVIPPIYTVDDMNADALCAAKYNIQTIVDVVVNDHYIEFVNPTDIDVICDWIKLYIDQVDQTGADTKNNVFYNNAKIARAKLGRITDERKEWELQKKPASVSLEAILAAL
jgi:hypothetical protein